MFSRKINVHVYANCVKLVTSILIPFAQRAKPASSIILMIPSPQAKPKMVERIITRKNNHSKKTKTKEKHTTT